MKVLHLLSTGTIGGIEVLCRDIAAVDPQNNVFVIMFVDGPIRERIRDTGAACYNLSKKNKFNIFGFTNELVKICEKEAIDVVAIHHEGLTNAIYYLRLQKRLPKLKYIRYLHSSFEEKYYYNSGYVVNLLKKKYDQWMIQRSDKLIAVSKFVRDSFEASFQIPQGKIQVVYNGVSEEMLQHNREVYMSRNIVKKVEDEIRLLYVGRLVEVKGIDILIHAFSMLKKEDTNVTLTLLGDGSYRKHCEKLVQEKGLQDSVSFEGFTLEKENYFKEGDIFVYPSRWQEAFGISIIEAMSYGILCVASNVGGIPEIVEDGVNGFLFESENSLKLLEKMRMCSELIRDGRKDTIAVSAMRTAERFNVKNTVESLKEIYQKL